jgi:xylulokinase
MTGLDQALPSVGTGAAFGDTFLAALATGHAQEGDIARWNPPAGTCLARTVPAYERHWTVFRALYERTHDLMRL